MMMLRIYAFIFGLLFVSSSRALSAEIKNADCDAWVTDTVRVTDSKRADTDIKGVQYSSPQEAAAALEAKRRMPFLAGVSISTDLCGAIVAACTPYGQYEAAARLNLRGRYFPVFEMGVGVSNHTNDATDLHYKVHSPYYRIGLDYNVAKNVRAQGRIFVGVRYAFSTYKFDVDGPDMVDPVYGGNVPFSYHGVRGTNHWGEAVFGLEARVWGILHLGWSIRYRMRFYNKRTIVDNSWYVPGYGKNDTHAIGGTFNVVVDI